MKQSKLNTEARTLCNRLASEAHRRAIWNDAATLRNLCKEKIASGATDNEVCAWLTEEYRKVVLGESSYIRPYIESPNKTP
jgi:hypothetical protein